MKNNNFSLKLVQFESTDRIILPGLLYKPKSKSDKVAIFLHGNGSSSVFYDVVLMNTLASYLGQKIFLFFLLITEAPIISIN